MGRICGGHRLLADVPLRVSSVALFLSTGDPSMTNFLRMTQPSSTFENRLGITSKVLSIRSMFLNVDLWTRQNLRTSPESSML